MPTPRAFARFALPLALVGAATVAACGGDATSPSTPALTPQEAKAVAIAIFEEIDRALGDSAGFSSSTIPANARLLTAPSLAAMPSFTTSVSSSCLKGGTLTGTVTFTDNTNSAGTGSVTETMAMSPHACVVSTGTKSIAVNGQVNMAVSATFTNSQPTSDLVAQTTGKLTWDGGSCDLNYSMRFTLQGALVLAGTVCGQPVDGSASL